MRRPDRNQRLWTCLLPSVLFLAVAGFPSSTEAQRGNRNAGPRHVLQLHQEKHRQLHEKLVESLESIAEFCDEKDFADEAEHIRSLIVPLDTQALHVESLPAEVQADIPRSLPEDERRWQVQLRHARKEYARELFLLSRRVLRAGSPSYAYQLVREVARHDPDHKPARRLLGYVRQGNEWLTPFAADMQRRRHVWHDRFGWLPKGHVERYEDGERYFNGRWISARQEAELRRDFRNAWQVRTEHFLVKTNHSLERGVEVAQALEDFHDVFFQTFAAFFNTPEQLRKLFEGAGSGSRGRTSERPYEVHYYATREEYNQRLAVKIPQIAITNGLYYTNDLVSYFYHDPDNDPTLFHEATHQLFYESAPQHRPIAQQEHFWIIEGIACYMESFRRDNGRVSLGDPRFIRFEAARYRRLADDYYVPLAEFTALGMNEFQSDSNISKNYSQASGLAHFFMHYEGGRYRDALIEHLSQHYSADQQTRAEVESLASLTGVDYAELDRQYEEYLREMQEALTADAVED